MPVLRTVSWAALAAALLIHVGCAREVTGDPPPARAFYYPLSLTLAPDGQHVWVMNSNFDQRFNAGWITSLDLGAIDLDRTAPVGAVDDIELDALEEPALKIPSLGGTLAVDEAGSLAAVPHRGEPRISLLNVGADGWSLTCGDAGATRGLDSEERRADCDSEHLFNIDHEAFEQDLFEPEIDNPFGLSLFTHRPASGAPQPLLAVGHLASSRLSVYHVDAAPTDGAAPTLTPARAIALGQTGTSAVLPHPDTAGNFLVVTSRAFPSFSGDPRSTLYAVDIARSLDEDLDRVARYSINSQVGGRDLVGLAFSPDGAWAFLANQSPDSVVMLDARLETIEELDDEGRMNPVQRPRFVVVGAAPVAGRPSDVRYLSRSNGDDLLAVASFDEDAVYFLAVRSSGLSVVGRVEPIGNGPLSDPPANSGPFAMLPVAFGGKELLLVASFFDHTVTVLDVTPLEPLAFRTIARFSSDETEPTERVR